jgi:hypothetical protein
MISGLNLYRITRAGMPPHIAYGGISRVTRLPAATTAPVPICTPESIRAPNPIHTSFSIIIFHFVVCSICSAPGTAPNIPNGYVLKRDISWFQPKRNCTCSAIEQKCPICSPSPISPNGYTVIFPYVPFPISTRVGSYIFHGVVRLCLFLLL